MNINLIFNVEVWGVDSDCISVSEQIAEVAARWSRSEWGGLWNRSGRWSEDHGRWSGNWNSLDNGNWAGSGNNDGNANTSDGSSTGGLLSGAATTASGHNGADGLGDKWGNLGDDLVDDVVGGREAGGGLGVGDCGGRGGWTTAGGS